MEGRGICHVKVYLNVKHWKIKNRKCVYPKRRERERGKVKILFSDYIAFSSRAKSYYHIFPFFFRISFSPNRKIWRRFYFFHCTADTASESTIFIISVSCPSTTETRERRGDSVPESKNENTNLCNRRTFFYWKKQIRMHFRLFAMSCFVKTKKYAEAGF